MGCFPTKLSTDDVAPILQFSSPAQLPDEHDRSDLTLKRLSELGGRDSVSSSESQSSRDHLCLLPSCLIRHVDDLQRHEAVQLTAAVAHLRLVGLPGVCAGDLALQVLQSVVRSILQTLLRIVTAHGGQVLCYSTGLLAVWDQAGEEEEGEADAGGAAPPLSCTALIRAVTCLLEMQRKCAVFDLSALHASYVSLSATLCFGELTLAAPWGISVPAYHLTGRPVELMQEVINRDMVTSVLVSDEAWFLLAPFCVGYPEGLRGWWTVTAVNINAPVLPPPANPRLGSVEYIPLSPRNGSLFVVGPGVGTAVHHGTVVALLLPFNCTKADSVALIISISKRLNAKGGLLVGLLPASAKLALVALFGGLNAPHDAVAACVDLHEQVPYPLGTGLATGRVFAGPAQHGHGTVAVVEGPPIHTALCLCQLPQQQLWLDSATATGSKDFLPAPSQLMGSAGYFCIDPAACQAFNSVGPPDLAQLNQLMDILKAPLDGAVPNTRLQHVVNRSMSGLLSNCPRVHGIMCQVVAEFKEGLVRHLRHWTVLPVLVVRGVEGNRHYPLSAAIALLRLLASAVSTYRPIGDAAEDMDVLRRVLSRDPTNEVETHLQHLRSLLDCPATTTTFTPEMVQPFRAALLHLFRAVQTHLELLVICFTDTQYMDRHSEELFIDFQQWAKASRQNYLAIYIFDPLTALPERLREICEVLHSNVCSPVEVTEYLLQGFPFSQDLSIRLSPELLDIIDETTGFHPLLMREVLTFTRTYGSCFLFYGQTLTVTEEGAEALRCRDFSACQRIQGFVTQLFLHLPQVEQMVLGVVAVAQIPKGALPVEIGLIECAFSRTLKRHVKQGCDALVAKGLLVQHSDSQRMVQVWDGPAYQCAVPCLPKALVGRMAKKKLQSVSRALALHLSRYEGYLVKSPNTFRIWAAYATAGDLPHLAAKINRGSMALYCRSANGSLHELPAHPASQSTAAPPSFASPVSFESLKSLFGDMVSAQPAAVHTSALTQKRSSIKPAITILDASACLAGCPGTAGLRVAGSPSVLFQTGLVEVDAVLRLLAGLLGKLTTDPTAVQRLESRIHPLVSRLEIFSTQCTIVQCETPVADPVKHVTTLLLSRKWQEAWATLRSFAASYAHAANESLTTERLEKVELPPFQPLWHLTCLDTASRRAHTLFHTAQDLVKSRFRLVTAEYQATLYACLLDMLGHAKLFFGIMDS
eukprot:EG_transcript_1029